MSHDSEIPSHAPGVVVTTFCSLARIGIGDFGVKVNAYIAFLIFTLGFINFTVLATSGVQLVA